MCTCDCVRVYVYLSERAIKINNLYIAYRNIYKCFLYTKFSISEYCEPDHEVPTSSLTTADVTLESNDYHILCLFSLRVVKHSFCLVYMNNLYVYVENLVKKSL